MIPRFERYSYFPKATTVTDLRRNQHFLDIPLDKIGLPVDDPSIKLPNSMVPETSLH